MIWYQYFNSYLIGEFKNTDEILWKSAASDNYKHYNLTDILIWSCYSKISPSKNGRNKKVVSIAVGEN